MSTNQGLNVQLGGDASQFIASLQAALAQAQAATSGIVDTASAMNALTAAANAASAAANTMNASLNSTQSATTSTTTSVNNLSNSVNNSGSLWQRLRSLISGYSNALQNGTSAIRNYLNSTIDSIRQSNIFTGVIGRLRSAFQSLRAAGAGAQSTLTNISRVAQDAPFGFIAIQNNIPPLIESFGRLSTASGGAMGALKAIAGALIGPAGIAFAVSAATSLITVAIQKYGSLGNAFESIFGTVSDATKSYRAHAEALKGASDEYVKAYTNVSTLRINLDLAKRGIIDKTGVVKQYNETIGKTTGAVKTLDEVEQGLAKNADAYIKFTLLKAAAQIALQKAAEQAVAAQEARAKPAEEVVPYISSGLKGKGKDAEKLYEKIAQQEREKIASENDKTQALFEKIAKEFQDQSAALAQKYKFNFFEDKKPKQKNVKTVEQILKELGVEMANIDLLAKNMGASFDSLSSDKVNAVKKALEDLGKIGVSQVSPVVQDLLRQLNLFANKTPGTLELSGKRLQEIGKAFKEVKVDPGALQNVDKFRSEFLQKVEDTQKAIQYKIDKNVIQWANISSGLGAASINIGDQLRGLAANSAAALGEVIGSLASGGQSLAQSLGRLIGVMGQFVIDFGKSLIEAATLRIIAEKTLLTNPYVALAAGVAAVAIGSVLKNSVPSFAEGGGLVGSPGLAMIGDNPGREEYVIPSEVLDKMGGGQRNVRVIGVLRGQDMLLQNERAKRAKARV